MNQKTEFAARMVRSLTLELAESIKSNDPDIPDLFWVLYYIIIKGNAQFELRVAGLEANLTPKMKIQEWIHQSDENTRLIREKLEELDGKIEDYCTAFMLLENKAHILSERES